MTLKMTVISSILTKFHYHTTITKLKLILQINMKQIYKFKVCKFCKRNCFCETGVVIYKRKTYSYCAESFDTCSKGNYKP